MSKFINTRLLFLIIIAVLIVFGLVWVMNSNRAIAPENGVVQNREVDTSDQNTDEKEKPHSSSANVLAEAENIANDSIFVTVTQGDTLWSLAEQYLGDGSRWEEIYVFNRDNLKSTWLTPNQTLEIIDCRKFTSHSSPEVQLLSPVGCEIWKRGSTYEISWIQKSILGATKAHLFCYEEDRSGNVVYRGAIEYHLPSLSSDPNRPNTYKWDIPTSQSFSCPVTGKKFMVNVVLANDNDERLGSATSGPLTILP